MEESTARKEPVTTAPSLPPLPDDNDDNDDDEYNLRDDEDEYSHLVQSMRSPTGLEIGVRITWPGVDKPIELSTCLPSQEIAPMFHGTQWAGTRVWKAAIVALQYMLDEQGPLKQEYLQQQPNEDDNVASTTATTTFSCIELGCGLGVPGMILHALYPNNSRIVLTDCEALLPQLQGNVAQNFSASSSSATAQQPSPLSLTAATLDWDEPADNLEHLLQSCQLESFDVVLNCDCIYEPLYGTSWKALLQVQVALLQRNATALVLTSLERRKFDGADKYLTAMRQHSAVTKVVLVHQDDPVEIYRIYGV